MRLSPHLTQIHAQFDVLSQRVMDLVVENKQLQSDLSACQNELMRTEKLLEQQQSPTSQNEADLAIAELTANERMALKQQLSDYIHRIDRILENP